VWYGLSSTGFASAAQHWEDTPTSHRLAGWEEGALAFWTGGSHGYGHCVIGAQHKDTIFSTDYPRTGRVGHTTVADITKAWGLRFAGWAKAYFRTGIAANATQAAKYTQAANATVPGPAAKTW